MPRVSPLGRQTDRQTFPLFSITEEMATPASEASGHRASCWSITINNPTEDDLVAWRSLSGLHWVREVTGQMEQGENGTPHLQGCLKTAQVRFAQVKKALPRAHIEVARNVQALQSYVVKEDTRIAPIAAVRVATAADLQRTIYNTLLWEGSNYFDTWDDTVSFVINVQNHRDTIRRFWEILLDEAVYRLIREGYYGIEFVVSNPQIRNAFKKYLPDILYRTHHAHDAPPP